MCARAPKGVPGECEKHACGVQFEPKMGDLSVMEPVCLMMCFFGPPTDPGQSASGHMESLKTILNYRIGSSEKCRKLRLHQNSQMRRSGCFGLTDGVTTARPECNNCTNSGWGSKEKEVSSNTPTRA